MMSQDSEILAIDLFLASRNAPPVHVPGNFETDSHSYISYLKAMNKLQNNGVPYTDAEEQEWLNDLKANDNSATSEITESLNYEMLAVESLEDEDEMIPEIILNAVHSADLLISPPRVLQCDNFVVSIKENVLENSEDEEDESSGYVFTTDRGKITPTSVVKSDIMTSTIEKAEDLDNISVLQTAELQDQDSELLLHQLLSATQPINDIQHNANSNNQHNYRIDSGSDDDMFSSRANTTRVAANHFRHRYLSSGNGVDTTSATVPGVGTDDIEDIVISDTDSDVEGDDTCDSGSKHSTQNINGAHIHANNHNINSNAMQSNNSGDNNFNNIDMSHILSELNGQFTDDYIKHKLSTHTTSTSGTRYLQPTGTSPLNNTNEATNTRFYEDVMPFDDGESLD